MTTEWMCGDCGHPDTPFGKDDSWQCARHRKDDMGTISFGPAKGSRVTIITHDVTGAPPMPTTGTTRASSFMMVPHEIEVDYRDDGDGWAVAGIRIMGRREELGYVRRPGLAAFAGETLADAPQWARRFARAEMPS